MAEKGSKDSGFSEMGEEGNKDPRLTTSKTDGLTTDGPQLELLKRAIQQGFQQDTYIHLNEFEPCIFEKKYKSQIFLNGALKISRSTFKDQFRFLGRLAGNQEFNEVSHFLRSRKSMVNVAY